MSKITVLSNEQHSRFRWQRYTSYAFAQAEAIVPLVISELPKAIMSLPVAFICQEGVYVPVAVLGLKPGQNLLVDQSGKWLGGYVPATLRGYPFLLVQHSDQLVMCVDEESGLVNDSQAGELLFGDDGKITESVQAVLDFLVHIQQSRAHTEVACAALERHGCIRPWAITHKLDAQKERKIEGLFQIDESALNALADDAFLELRQAGALLLAYCQLLSVQHLPLLAHLAEARTSAPVPVTNNGKDIDLSFLSDGGVFNFSGIL